MSIVLSILKNFFRWVVGVQDWCHHTKCRNPIQFSTHKKKILLNKQIVNMVCKGTPREQCLASSDCVWISRTEKRKGHCRQRPSRGRRSQTMGRGGGQGQQRDLKDYTMTELKKHPMYGSVKGRSKMRKAELVQALRQKMRGGGQQQRQSSGGSVETMLRRMHEGFVATDSQGRLRMRLPRDASGRFLSKRIVNGMITDDLLNQPSFYKNDDVVYFFMWKDDFYDTFDKPKYTGSGANAMEVSQALERWFKKHKFLGGLRRGIRMDGSPRWNFDEENTAMEVKRGNLMVFDEQMRTNVMDEEEDDDDY